MAESTIERLRRREREGQASFNPITNEWARDLRSALHLTDSLSEVTRELIEASKGFMGCQSATEMYGGEFAPCAACWGCRLEAAVQRAEKVLAAASEANR